MLNALSVSIESDAEQVRRAETSLAAQGFVPAVRFDWETVSLRGWTTGDTALPEEHIDAVRLDDGFSCCVGPLWYRGAFGRDALLRLLRDAGPNATVSGAGATDLPGAIEADEIRGCHAIFLQRGASAWLWNDAPGFVHVFGSSDGRFHSTSWLAARAYEGSNRIDEGAAVEYVLLGASHSERTVAAGVERLGLGQAIDLRHRRPHRWLAPEAWHGKDRIRSADQAREALVVHLRKVFAEIASAFPQRTRAALSGGFDSRLIVAGLLEQHEQPDLFVYGDASSSDVAIATEIAHSEGLRLQAIDKGALNAQLGIPDLEELVSSARFFDGLPNDGVLDPGADRRTRIAQSADGHIALNGGGGEIFRNFFHLPDRPFRPVNVVRAFYRGFDARVLRGPRALSTYQARLADSIAHCVGGADEDGRLSREQIERVYPLFRCHYWMGVNNGVALRSGYFATPLVDLPAVRVACSLPLAWKNAGALQSALIDALHPGIARYRSSYGFRFSDGPSASARRSEWATRIRPVIARPLINATRRRLQGAGIPPSVLGRYRAMLDGEWRLDSVLDLQRLSDEAAFSRAVSVELVARGLVA